MNDNDMPTATAVLAYTYT